MWIATCTRKYYAHISEYMSANYLSINHICSSGIKNDIYNSTAIKIPQVINVAVGEVTVAEVVVLVVVVEVAAILEITILKLLLLLT